MPSMRSRTAPAPSQKFAPRLPRRRTPRLSRRPASASTSIGRSAPRSAPIATSTAMCASGGIDEARFLRRYLKRVAALGDACAGPHGHQHILRRRHALADAADNGRRGPRCASAATWTVAPDAEITLEANPSSVEAARFRGYRAAGVNRVSLGVQSLDDARSARARPPAHGRRKRCAAIDVARATRSSASPSI